VNRNLRHDGGPTPIEADAKEEKAMLRTNRTTRLLIATFTATALVGGLVACGSEDTSSAVSTAGAHATPGAVERTVVVYSHVPAPSPSQVTLHAGLEEGQLPAEPVTAVVVTDEECEPDAQGISHCRNEVQLPSGEMVVLRHLHDMMQVECLAPGEEVLLRRA
jgi:hypothetical protein